MKQLHASYPSQGANLISDYDPPIMALFIVSPLLSGPCLSLGSILAARSLADVSLLPNTVSPNAKPDVTATAPITILLTTTTQTG